MKAGRTARFACGIAGILALVSALMFGALAMHDAHALSAVEGQTTTRGVAYRADLAISPVEARKVWRPPVAQTRGPEWVYDLFTPPEIFYHAGSKRFAIKMPDAVPGIAPEAQDERFGLELIAVEAEPFPLQLIGYVGAEGNWRGTFEDLATREVSVAGEGHAFPALNLVVARFDVRPESIRLADSMTTQQRVATATVRDVTSGDETILTHRERRRGETLFAIVALEGATREVREGDTVRVGEDAYRIQNIRLAPPAIDVTKGEPQTVTAERRTLFVRDATPLAPTTPGTKPEAL